MSMERWNPFRDFDTMRQTMDRWMDERLPGNFSNQQGNMLSIALDVHETQNGYELEASLPGVKPEDLDIQVDRETITIRGQSQSSQERKDERNFLYRERRSGSFFRTIRLPEPINADGVEATLDHGILKLQLPRLAQTQQRRVQVRSGSMPGQMSGQSATSGGPTDRKAGEAGSVRVENSSERGWTQAGDARSTSTQHGVSVTEGGSGSSEMSSSQGGSGTGSTDYSSNSRSGGMAGSPMGETGGQQAAANLGQEPGGGPKPGQNSPGASHGEHSQVDHRNETGGQTYTSGGYRQSPQNTGTSADGPDSGMGAQSGAGQYGAGQGGGTTSQSQTMGNNQ